MTCGAGVKTEYSEVSGVFKVPHVHVHVHDVPLLLKSESTWEILQGETMPKANCYQPRGKFSTST